MGDEAFLEAMVLVLEGLEVGLALEEGVRMPSELSGLSSACSSWDRTGMAFSVLSAGFSGLDFARRRLPLDLLKLPFFLCPFTIVVGI